MTAPGDPANWTPEQAHAAQAELDELERTDPDVAAAAASYDCMVERVNSGRRCPACGTAWIPCAKREGTIGSFCCGECDGSHRSRGAAA